MHIIEIDMFYNEQKQNKMCKKLASQIHCRNKNVFKLVILCANGILQRSKYIHGLQHDVAIASHSLIPTTMHEFYDSKGHQRTIGMFEAIRKSYWWPKL